MKSRSGRLANKIALITGGVSGIGWAAAERFAQEGATVIIADKAADRFAERISVLRAYGDDHRHQAVQLDATSESDWTRMLNEVDATFGRLDVLVNNVGYGAFRSIDETSFQEWRTILAINLDSVFLGTKYAMPLLARAGKASIINISSIRGLVAGHGTGAYSAAKGGVRLFTKSTAIECAALGNGVRANSVHPGQIETPLLIQAMAGSDRAKSTLERIPMGRFGTPLEIADALVFLASDESTFMTGSEVTIDGGFTAQ
jgi:Dehydrogenases with different specificities (related to short-chain alcohol dehydrogenases)